MQRKYVGIYYWNDTFYILDIINVIIHMQLFMFYRSSSPTHESSQKGYSFNRIMKKLVFFTELCRSFLKWILEAGLYE